MGACLTYEWYNFGEESMLYHGLPERGIKTEVEEQPQGHISEVRVWVRQKLRNLLHDVKVSLKE